MKRLATVTLATLCLGTLGGVAQATHSPNSRGAHEFAVGGGRQGTTVFAFAAQGEGTFPGTFEATGFFHYRFQNGALDIRGDVQCLNVVGRAAIFEARIRPGSAGVPAGASFVSASVADSDSVGTADQLRLETFGQGAIGCNRLPTPFGPVIQGNIVVHDNTP